jgi:hypothetical protein
MTVEQQAGTSPAERALYTTAGFALVLYASAERRLGRAVGAAQRLGRPPAALASRLLPRSTRAVVQQRVHDTESAGRLAVAAGLEQLRTAASTVAVAAAQDPIVVDVVLRVVDRVAPDLLDELLPEVLDRLTADPVQIQALIRGQSRDMAEGVAREARRRAASGDDVVDRLVGRVLHRRTRPIDEPAPATPPLTLTPS